MRLNPDRLIRTLTTLDIFIDRSLELTHHTNYLSGFHYNRDLLLSSLANTYVETVGNKADSLHLAIKNVPISNIYWEYLRTVKIVGKRFNLQNLDVILAFDYTDEDFYGKPRNMWLHSWTGENGVTSKFKFLTAAIISSEIPEKIPLISIPIQIGHNLAKEVCFCITLIRPLVKTIRLLLFDRGFYSKELMLTLNSDYPYLIFVPKNKRVKKELSHMVEKEKKKIYYEFKLNKDKTILRGKTTLALLKQIFDSKAKKTFDWAFATNQDEINLDNIVATYKGRWRIETGFRVQDEAKIKSKSTDIKVRFFLFVYEQVLQMLWIALYKEEVSFKEFLLNICELCENRSRKAEKRQKPPR